MDPDDSPAGPPQHPWTAHGHSPWTYPSGHHYGPPSWPPTYWVPGPPPPPPSRWRSAAALLGVVLILGGLGAGVAIAVQHVNSVAGLTGTNTSDLNSAIVDVNTDLGGGNSAAGTGMVLSSNGMVLTNNHVVEGSFSVNVQLVSSGQTYTAKVVGVDPTDDVAVVQLSNVSGLATTPLGNSSQVTVGDSVTALGNALGRGGAPTPAQGTVTALNQTITATDETGGNAETLNGMIEFNAQIQPGDSGGPLVDSSGKVVGMTTAGGGNVRGRSQAASLGYAIPINNAMSIARQIMSGTPAPNITTARTPLLGVEAQDSQSPAGALVVGVRPGSPAESAGLHAQDVIVSVGSATVDSVASLHSALAQHHPGDTVSVGWLDSGGQQHSANVQLATGSVP